MWCFNTELACCFFHIVKWSNACSKDSSMVDPPNHLSLHTSNTLEQVLYLQGCNTAYKQGFQHGHWCNLSAQTSHGSKQATTVDPASCCPIPRCHVCIWSGGASNAFRPGTTCRAAGPSARMGEGPGRWDLHVAFRLVHHQSSWRHVARVFKLRTLTPRFLSIQLGTHNNGRLLCC